jgi:DDE superfamily endonuclease
MDRASRILAQGLPGSFAARADDGKVAKSTLHARAQGRRSREEKDQGQQYLSPSEEKAIVKFLLQMADLGRPVRIKYIPSLAFSIASKRSTNRPSKPPGRNWPQSFERRHPELKARKVKALDWDRHPNSIYDKMVEWFQIIGDVLDSPDVLQENVYNMDETGIMLSKLGSVKVLVGKNDGRDFRGARVKRTTVTAIECISADGRYLHPMIIWPASTHRSNWTIHPTPGWHYACSETGYTDSKISLEWLKRVFDPQTKERANQRPRVLICDVFGTHETVEILEFCFGNNIILCRLPSHTSHKLQPCDLSAFAPLKTAYRDRVELMERGGVGKIGKEHFTALYSPARTLAFSKKNILSGWAKAGLFPRNPERVLRDTPKTAQLTPQTGQVVEVCPDPRCEVVQSPVMPMTPVDAEALITLQGLINQDAHALSDERSRLRLQWYAQKLANAAKTSFAERALQQDQIRFLFKVNKEGKVRQSTKALILGKAKVMSYEDLQAARAKRAAKEKAKATVGTGKRGRKPKNALPKEEEATTGKAERGRKRKYPEPEGVEATARKIKRDRKRINQAPEAEAAPSEPIGTLVVRMSEEPARAPVARMI